MKNHEYTMILCGICTNFEEKTNHYPDRETFIHDLCNVLVVHCGINSIYHRGVLVSDAEYKSLLHEAGSDDDCFSSCFNQP